MKNVFTAGSDKLVKTIFHTRHPETGLMSGSSSLSQGLEHS